MKNKILWLSLLTVVFSTLRFYVPSEQLSLAGSYQAFAHLFVGGLLGAYLTSKNKFYLDLTILLSVVELIAFSRRFF